MLPYFNIYFYERPSQRRVAWWKFWLRYFAQSGKVGFSDPDDINGIYVTNNRFGNTRAFCPTQPLSENIAWKISYGVKVLGFLAVKFFTYFFAVGCIPGSTNLVKYVGPVKCFCLIFTLTRTSQC
jgi:hypothetical protein